MADEARLLLTDYHRRGFPRASWRAISTWGFTLVSGPNDRYGLLEALLHDDAYAYSFTSPYPEYPKQNARGPYVLSRLSVDSFIPVSAEEVGARLDQFLADVDPPAARSDLDLDMLVGTALDQADELFELQGSENDCRDFAWILTEFMDFVAIGPDGNSLLVLTAHED